VIGEVSHPLAEELGLPPSAAIVAGAHDQCANALGCGVIHEGQAMYGMGTYICVTPVYEQRKDPARMMARGLNTEHHAAPGLFASFIYNPGGALVKWYRDTFASVEKKQIMEIGGDIYPHLISEIPQQPSDVLVLPHFAPTGPPEFITDSSGVMIGLRLETQRGEILKGILEGTTYYIRECIESLPETGITIQDFRAVGGGSKSNAWIQICADILGCPISRPVITEAGALGAAILGGIGKGIFSSVKTGVEAMVSVECTFDPNPNLIDQYTLRYEQYRQIWPLMKHFLLAH
jgi:xylulokinase